jgi:hypothetical protein
MSNDIQQEIEPTNEKSNNKEQLIDLLEFEIQQIHLTESQTGWTHWALLGALASALWLITIEHENNSIILHNVCFLFLLFNLAVDLIGGVSTLFSQDVVVANSRPRFLYSNLGFASTRLSLLVQIIRIGLLFTIVAINPGLFLSPLAMSGIIVFYFPSGLLFLVMFILTFFKIPLPSRSSASTLPGKLLTLCAIIIGAITISLLVNILIANQTIFQIPEYRMSGLLLTITYITVLLSKWKFYNPILNNLIKTRRDLALEHITYEAAKDQIDIAFEGLKATDVVQNEVSLLLSELNIFSAELDLAEKNFKEVAELLENYKDGFTDRQRTIVVALLKATLSHLANGQSANIKVGKYLDAYKRKSNYLSGIVSTATKDLEPLVEIMSKVVNSNDDKISKLESILDTCEKQVKKMLGN